MLNLVIYPDPVLDKVCTEVTIFNDHLKSISQEMFALMYKSNGIGLAAPQVGLTDRIFVMDVDNKKRVVINPKIVKETGLGGIEEGCLSFPGIRVKVDRSMFIDVEYYDESGALVKEKLSGLEAICFQHELDHLNGKTFIDILSSTTKSFIAKKLERQKREQRT